MLSSNIFNSSSCDATSSSSDDDDDDDLPFEDDCDDEEGPDESFPEEIARLVGPVRSIALSFSSGVVPFVITSGVELLGVTLAIFSPVIHCCNQSAGT